MAETYPEIDLTSTVDTPSAAPGHTPVDLLAELTAALDAAVPVPTLVVPVEHRPGWAVRYRLNVSWRELQAWRRTAGGGKRVPSNLELSALMLANTCVGFVKDGVEAVDAHGEPITFGTIAAQRGGRVADAVKFWLVVDGSVISTSDVVYARSGYAPQATADLGEDEAGEPDPTQA